MQLEELIEKEAPGIAEQFRQAAGWAKNEEDLRIECERELEAFRKKANLNIKKGRHEVWVGGGRADSVYASVVIEYKKPKRLTDSNSSAGNREAISQLKDRIEGFAQERHKQQDRMLGMGTDGLKVVFVRYRAGNWQIDQPADVDAKSMLLFLKRFCSLGIVKKPMLPDYLEGDFASQSDVALRAVNAFHESLRDLHSPKAKVLFRQWQFLFREVCGYDLETPKPHIRELAKQYNLPEQSEPSMVLFPLHSYYAVFIKLLAAEMVSFHFRHPSFLGKLHSLTGLRLRDALAELEEGGIFKQLGIRNFLEGDLFSWYLSEWDDQIEAVIRSIIDKLDEYDPLTLSIEPDEARDLLKCLYQYLFPKKVRHDLGEYYTPDWLAELVLDRLGYDGNPDRRILDPACGSGTFLVLIINRIRRYCADNLIPEDRSLLEKIKANVIGFDLNPVAVMTARTNYLLALGNLLRLGGDIEVPVYLCDSILTPAESGWLGLNGKDPLAQKQLGGVKELKTSAGPFYIPIELARSSEHIGRYTEHLDFCVRNGYSAKEFIERCRQDCLPMSNATPHADLYQRVLQLEKENRNRIWSRIIKNAFAPLFIGKVDFVAGNPPWVNWENLPADYREETAYLWDHYKLAARGQKGGRRPRLGAVKVDISALMTYVAMDAYLKEGGKLGFVITQSVFKTAGAGQGFRRFRLGQKGPRLGVLKVDDMVALKPFEDASNRTAVMVVEKGKSTEYPVPYVVWRKAGAGRGMSYDSPLADVKAVTKRLEFAAKPVADDDPTSPWLTARPGALRAIRKTLGESDYDAHAGVCTWANAVFWVEVLEKLPDGLVLVRNITEGAKRKVPQVTRTIEPDLLYPLLRGRDVSRWRAEPQAFIIVPQDPARPNRGMKEAVLKRSFPKTYAYLKRFEDVLVTRSGFKLILNRRGDPFYALMDIDTYTFAPWKVVWTRLAKIEAAVSAPSGRKPAVPQETVTLVSCASAEEAHFIAALVNSTPFQFAAVSYSQAGGKSMGSMHVLHNIRIPSFDCKDDLHENLGELSKAAHEATRTDDTKELQRIEAEIDHQAAKLWGLSTQELEEIQGSLRELEQ